MLLQETRLSYDSNDRSYDLFGLTDQKLLTFENRRAPGNISLRRSEPLPSSLRRSELTRNKTDPGHCAASNFHIVI